jgi:hypothetical protein
MKEFLMGKALDRYDFFLQSLTALQVMRWTGLAANDIAAAE